MWIAIGYVIVGLFVARRIFAHIIKDPYFDELEDRIMMGMVSFLCGMFWPLAIPMALVMYKPKKDKSQELQKRILELEDSMNIKRSEF